MIRLKYILSGLMLAMLTVFVMLFPNVYHYYSDKNMNNTSPREVLLEQTIHKPTANEMMRLLTTHIENGSFASIEVMGDRTVNGENGYTADCRHILEAVLGEKTDNKITQLLLGKIENAKEVYVRVYQCVLFWGSDIITTNIVTAQYDQLYICYEEDFRLALEITLLPKIEIEEDTEDPQLYSSLYQSRDHILNYYTNLGLTDKEFEYYAYHSGYDPLLSIRVSRGLIETKINDTTWIQP